MKEIINCPWCDSRNHSEAQNCAHCGGPLPAEIGDDPGPEPPLPVRKLPKGFTRRMILRGSSLGLVGIIFFFVGLPFIIAFPIIGIATGEPLFALIGGLLGGLFVILGGVLGAIGTQKALGRVRTFQYGLATEGKVMSIEKDHSIQINGQSPWRVEYSFDVRGIVYQNTELSWKYADKHHAVGNVVHVLFMPDDPENSVIYPPVT